MRANCQKSIELSYNAAALELHAQSYTCVCIFAFMYICTSAHVYYLVVPLGGSCRSAPAGAVHCAGRGSLVQDSLGHLPTKFSCTLETFQSSSTLARKGSAALITTVSGNFCG